ncbi:MAG: tripartite tricarboxylate transporter substrate binding protein [Spirochaetales bacterium]|nr:tripartite tricarboxylate transporter substrate binding protein [Spirochaetales bacterium]
MRKNSFVFTVFILLLCITVSVWSTGQKEEVKYPTRAINVLVGFGAGGPTDVIARGIIPILQEKLGVGIGITNMPGASSATAASYVLKQPADGYTLFMGSEIMSMWQTMGTMDLSPVRDFIPIKLVCEAVPVLAVPPNSRFNSAQEFIAYAQAHQGELRIGTAGPGTVPHISGLLLTKVLGCKFTFVPYQGGGPAVTAVMGGQVDATIEMIQGMVSNYHAGKLKILASFTNEPLEGLNIPPIGKIEPKLAPYVPYGPYFGLFAPKGTPEAIVKILKDKMDEAIKDPRWSEYCKKLYLPQIDYSGEEAIKYLNKWTSKSAWLMYEVGGAENSPEKFGIPKP